MRWDGIEVAITRRDGMVLRWLTLGKMGVVVVVEVMSSRFKT